MFICLFAPLLHFYFDFHEIDILDYSIMITFPSDEYGSTYIPILLRPQGWFSVFFFVNLHD